MAVGLNTGVPWITCKQDDAPDPIINTCNAFVPNQYYKPNMFTELWSGWYTPFCGAVAYRPIEDVAFAVTTVIQNGCSFVNYYMYHGGTNFGTTVGRFVTTSYDYDALIDKYGLAREPKYTHLKYLHKAIKKCESALISNRDHPIGSNQEEGRHRRAVRRKPTTPTDVEPTDESRATTFRNSSLSIL